MRVGIGVLEQVDGVAGRCFPREHFNEAVTVDLDDAFVVGGPADGVVYEQSPYLPSRSGSS